MVDVEKKMDVLSYMKTQSNLTPHLLARDNGSGVYSFISLQKASHLFFLQVCTYWFCWEKKKKIFSHTTLELFIHEYRFCFISPHFLLFLTALTKMWLFLFLFFLLPELCSRWDLSSLTRDGTCALCSGSKSPNHWTAREVPNMAFTW